MPLSVMYSPTDKPLLRASEINPDVSPAVEALLLKTTTRKWEAFRFSHPLYTEGHAKGLIEIPGRRISQ